MTFINLCNHTHYSLLTGLPKPEDYVLKAKEYNVPGVCITDLGNVYGCHEFYKSAKDNGINPILGTQVYVVNNGINDKSRENVAYNLTLLAKNNKGFENILEIVTYSNLYGFHNKPRVDFDTLKKYSENLICLSNGIESDISFLLLSGKTDEQVFEKIKFYQSIFGSENYFLQLEYHDDLPKQKYITDRLIGLHKKYDIKVVALNSAYYIDEKDKKTQDVLMCLNTGHEMENPDRNTFINGDYSFFSPEKINKLFGFLPSSIENTIEINNRIKIDIKTGGMLIPKFELESDLNEKFEVFSQKQKEEKLKIMSTDEWYLRYLRFKGLNKRFDFCIDEETILEFVKKVDIPKLGKTLQEINPSELETISKTYYTNKKKEILNTFDLEKREIMDRIEYELFVVHEMRFDGYFLIVADYINWAKENDIPVGPGRGSAAGALLAYLSGITDINPLKYGLLFERFLNPARVSMPDIDTDFSDEDRDRVIEYCRKKYGEDRVAQICTFGTFAARAAVKDVGRTRGVLFSEMNDFVKLIPEKPGTKLKEALEDSPEFKSIYDSNNLYKEIVDDALKIEGNVRQLGVHACAVIIAPEKITKYTALQHPPKDDKTTITQYNAYPLEDLGLLKMDFLGLRNLSIIKKTLKIINKQKGIKIDLSKIDTEDPKVFEVFASGDTTGVFQFGSDGMRKYLKELKPTCFEDIIVMVSLYRPGPLEWIPVYINRKNGKEKVEYPHPSLENILKATQGIAVYQEQIMQLVQAFAGFSLGEADILRRAIGKKKIDVLMEQKGKFVDAAFAQGHSKDLALYIFEKVIEPFAGYGFNKSHAACYSMIAYETAFLKAYYRTEFLTALMMTDEEKLERVALEVEECRQKGIQVLPPSVNESRKDFTYIDDKTIRFGLKTIKGIGDGPIDCLIKSRKEGGKYKDLVDFVRRAGSQAINKKTIEGLALSGALDDFGNRGEILASINEILNFNKNFEKKEASSQLGFFDVGTGNDFEDKLVLNKVRPMTREEILFGEKEVLGLVISGHPFDGLEKYIVKKSIGLKLLQSSFEDVIKDPKIQGKKVKTVGYVYDIRKLVTKGGKPMMFIYCHGLGFDFEVMIFPRDYDKFASLVKLDHLVLIDGNIDFNLEYKKRSIKPTTMKFANISSIIESAKRENLFEEGKKYSLLDYVSLNYSNDFIFEKSDLVNSTDEKNVLENQIETSLIEEPKVDTYELYDPTFSGEDIDVIQNDFCIIIPNNLKKEDLFTLKTFLETLNKGNIKIFIELKGQKIDTKVSIDSLDILKKWLSDNWKTN